MDYEMDSASSTSDGWEEMRRIIYIYMILIGKPVGKRSLGRNIKMHLREREGGVVWNALICLRVRTGGGLL
jgi:hypothetical protein